MMTKIGDTLWHYDLNRRVYKDAKGSPSAGPTERGYYMACKVVGDADRSWLVETYPGGTPVKVAKQRVEKGEAAYFTTGHMEARIYVRENAHRIAEVVGRCQNANVLQEIASLVGYTPC